MVDTDASGECCGTCGYWRELANQSEVDRLGLCCIRSTPGAFPTRREYAWCGEWAPPAGAGGLEVEDGEERDGMPFDVGAGS